MVNDWESAFETCPPYGEGKGAYGPEDTALLAEMERTLERLLPPNGKISKTAANSQRTNFFIYESSFLSCQTIQDRVQSILFFLETNCLLFYRKPINYSRLHFAERHFIFPSLIYFPV